MITTSLVVIAIVLAIMLLFTTVQRNYERSKAEKYYIRMEELDKDNDSLIVTVQELRSEVARLKQVEAVLESYKDANADLQKRVDEGTELLTKANIALSDCQVAYENLAKDYNNLWQKEQARLAKLKKASEKSVQSRRNRKNNSEQTKE